MFKRFIMLGLSFLLATGAIGVAAVSADSKYFASTETAPKTEDPTVLANAVLEGISGKAHPYVLYSDAETESLREKACSGNSKKAYDIIETTAKSLVNSDLRVNASSKGIIGRQLQYYVTYLSFYSMLSGNDTYANKAVEIAVSAARSGNVEMYFSINDALSVGDFGHAYALAYDLLYNYMTEDERRLIKTELEEIGEWIYTNSPEINTWGADTANRKAWNWNAVTHGALGLISISLGDHQEWLELAISRAQGYYEFSVDGTGAAMEGLHYIGYALNSLAPFDLAIYRACGTELMDAYPAFREMTYWSMLYMTTPWGQEQVAINQGDNLGNYSGPFYIINRYGQSDALWAWEHTYCLSGDGKFTTEYQGNGWSAPAIILFEDQSLKPQAPTAEKNPLIKTYDKGLVIARNSWEKNASMITFTSGYGQSGCWNHPDDNSFTFYAEGESFIVDLGANRKTSAEHNVVSIDGVGMDFEGGPTMKEGVIEDNRILDSGNLYLRGNNITSYGKQKLKSSIRQLVYGDGEVPFVLIYDYVRKDYAKHTYTINFYTKSDNKIAIDTDGNYATIEGCNTGKVCYVIPYSPDGVALANIGNALSTEVNSAMLRQITLFIVEEPDGSMPAAEFAVDGKDIIVNITRTHGGERITETYVFGVDELVSFGTTEILEEETTVPSETESTETETVTESEALTDNNTESEVLTDINTESEYAETKDTQTTGSADQNSNGCGSIINAAIIPAAAVSTVTFLTKKKKKQ